ncbi:hypothetical protein LTR15_009252 [Elasticomyces elasticus]|nr:hypothetical protein LTR15_009252 [Elasticomyces elasticus]
MACRSIWKLDRGNLRAEVLVLGTSVWRQMSLSVVYTHSDTVDRASLTTAQNKDDVDEADEDGEDQMAATLASLSNYSLPEIGSARLATGTFRSLGS